MRRFVTLLLLLVACDQNPITEVGNPTTTSIKTRGAVSALGSAAANFVSNNSQTQALLLGLVKHQESSVQNEVIYECQVDESGNEVTCTCPGGGRLIDRYGATIIQEEGDVVTYEDTFETTYENCIITSCATAVTLNGVLTTTSTGTFSNQSNESTSEIRYATTEACSGFVVNGSSLGLQLIFGFVSTETDFQDTASGSLCEEGETPVTFSNLDELESLLDPSNTCTDLNFIF